MSDWEIVETSNKNKNPEFNVSDWEIQSPSIESETFLDKLPRNIATGLANLGHSTLNSPHDIAQGFEDFGESFGKKMNDILPLPAKYQELENQQPKYNFKLSEHIPYQQEYDFAKMLGQTGQPTWSDYLIQKGVEHSPELMMAGNALRNVVPHLTRRGAASRLNEARRLGEERNIGPLNVNPELIEDMQQYLPNTMPYRNAIEEARNRNYQPLFRLQSDVGKTSGKAARSWRSTFAEREHGREGLRSVNRLLDSMEQSLRESNHHDIADLMRQGRQDYRRYMAFKPYRNALLGAGIGTLGLKGLGISPINGLMSLLNESLSRRMQ